MTVAFQVNVTLDSAEIECEGKRLGFTLEHAHETVIADVENTLFDGLRHKSGVARVGVTLTGAHREYEGADRVAS